ncbi:hypothetical protein LXL04_010283 [Taraxacum kok-saghyz]
MEFVERNSMGEPPMLLNGDNFYIWKKRMIAFLNFTNSYFLESIKNGPHIPLTEKSKWSEEDKQKIHFDKQATFFLTLSLPNDIFTFVMDFKSAKEMWDNLILLFEGSHETREYRLICEHIAFEYKYGESVSETFIRFNCLINELKEVNVTYDNVSLLVKFLGSVNPALKHVRHLENLRKKSLKSVYGPY